MLESIFFNNTIAFLIVTIIIVVIHEYGHYLFARLFGVEVEVFSVGFGTKLFSFIDKAKTKWQICLLPLGGFVKIKGQEASFDEDEAKKVDPSDHGNFVNKNPLQKCLIVFAGPLFNLILAVVVIFSIFAIYGKPEISPVISEVMAGSIAEKYELKAGDKILKINDIDIKNPNDIADQLMKLTTNNITLTIQDSEKNQKEIDVILNDDHKLGIKIGSEMSINKIDMKDSFIESIKYTNHIVQMCVSGVKKLIIGDEKMKNLGGIIQIAKSSGEAMRSGFENFLFLIALLSINLAILNLLPIPGLDGGHLVFYILDCLYIGRFIKPKIRMYAVTCGFIFLIGLMVLANSNDLIKMFNKN